MLSLYDIQDTLGTGTLDTIEDARVEEWVIDTRRISEASKAIFVALRGQLRDGHDFIEDAYKRGIRRFLVSQPVSLPDDAIIFTTTDTLVALQRLAAVQRQRYTGVVVGVTGSYGKTIFKEWLAYALSDKKIVYKSPKSYNSQIGVAISLLEMDDLADIAIIEAGISEKDEMDRLQNMIQPTVGVLTSIGDMHDEGFLNIEEKLIEKLKLFKDSKYTHVGILPSPKLVDIAESQLKAMGVANRWILDTDYTQTTQNNLTRVCSQTANYEIPFEDKGSVELSLLLYQTLSHTPTQVDSPEIMMPTLTPISMRMEYLDAKDGSKIINDAYSIDNSSLKIALSVLSNQSSEWRKTIILSQPSVRDITPNIKELLLTMSQYPLDKYILIGEDWVSEDCSMLQGEIQLFRDTTHLLDSIDTLDLADQYILIKGARNYHLEKVVQVLQLQKHAVSLEVNLNNLRDNLLHYKSQLRPDTKMMIMVKSQSYGTGEYEVAKHYQNWGVDYLGVAYTDEGVSLRQKGIHLPIMVMNPELEGIETALDHGLEIEVYNDRILDAVCDVAYRRLLRSVPIHLKLDTGMHRLGWTRQELPELLSRLQQHPMLSIRSTFTHLYAADMIEGRQYVHNQVREYRHLLSQIEAKEIDTGMHHVLNTAGIEFFPEYQMDMVRLGIGAYGLSHAQDKRVKNVLSLKAEIAQISEVKKGEHLGYGLHTMMQKDSRIATVNVGYADGYMRALGNGKADVYIRGVKYPTIGNVCMDMLFVDISDAQNIVEGDDVELIGEHIDIRKLAESAGTISYEIMTGISDRIPRVYNWD